MNNFHYENEFFQRVIEQYSNMIVRIAFQKLRSQDEAEDILQEVLIKLLEHNLEFENERHLKAWLIRVTVNLCKNSLKSSWYRKRVPFNENSSNSFITEDIDVLEELFLLSPKYRTVIYLYYYEEYTLQEIADILGKSVNTVSSQLQRARKKLKIIIRGSENG